MHLRTTFCLSLSLLLACDAVAAVRGHSTLYVSGTTKDLTAGQSGTFDPTGKNGTILFISKDGKSTLSIPDADVTAMEYGEHAGRRVGATIALGVTTLGLAALPVLFSKKKRHYLTIYYNTDPKLATTERAKLASDPNATAQGDVVVFEINKNDYANDLQELQAKTGVKVSMEKAKR